MLSTVQKCDGLAVRRMSPHGVDYDINFETVSLTLPYHYRCLDMSV